VGGEGGRAPIINYMYLAAITNVARRSTSPRRLPRFLPVNFDLISFFRNYTAVHALGCWSFTTVFIHTGNYCCN
jgi:hypothetical protein